MLSSEMEVDAFLADSAEAVQGKLYAIGMGWDVIRVSGFPTIHPRVALALTIRVPYNETNRTHSLSIKLLSEDGDTQRIGMGLSDDGSPGELHEISADFNVGRPPQLTAGDSQSVPIALVFDQLAFAGPGMFSWQISVDGREVRRLPMRVTQDR